MLVGTYLYTVLDLEVGTGLGCSRVSSDITFHCRDRIKMHRSFNSSVS